jgi:antitoxin component of MazEF toxin-antitoxin module
MEAVIRKWGTSPALRLPSSELKKADLLLSKKLKRTTK